eukprot:CAMPEP_0182901278 /NCGR_PEP_ID=MMETSP0034_2-20130328/29515_1 /TAXON_ID=156128 /ORGANISM="Nephroselmis pyriformis, Strain CCMP717" /LENGTH=36 /DNA_ID= /DNA_START= /DNA_END= /DNA_ORIENTATION=
MALGAGACLLANRSSCVQVKELVGRGASPNSLDKDA